MEFNKNWTKEKNDQLRKMISEGKSNKDIIFKFGDDLKYHPKGKYNYEYLKGYSNFIKEILINPRSTYYRVERVFSNFFEDKYDYVLHFNLNDHDYVIILFYYLTNNKESYNLLFTTLGQYTEYINELNILSKKQQITENDFNKLSTILESQTNYDELYKLIGSISYILFSFYPNIKNYVLSISNTNNPIKIKLYRNIINCSFKNIKETEEIDDRGKNIYYYEIN